MGLFWIYQQMPIFMGLIVLIAVWDVVWKGIALWREAKRREAIWFIALLILNTAGILPILYLVFTSDPDKRTGIVRIEKANGKMDAAEKKASAKKVAKKSASAKSAKKSSKSAKKSSSKKTSSKKKPKSSKK